MQLDADVKIAGDKPSRDVKRNRALAEDSNINIACVEKARKWGEAVAVKFIADAKENEDPRRVNNLEMIIQRRMLLSFTATVGFEQLSPDDTIAGIAQKSFLDTVKRADSELYRTSGDTGAFSFYYLAFRRGGDIERRIGQTFAMLCSHDGDPIYHELGEALYCWFLSVVKQTGKDFGIYE